MEHNRKTKMITIVARIVAVLGLSIDLSAYSKTLNIQNVQASVAGNQSNFDVVFSTSSEKASTGLVPGTSVSGAPGTGGIATLDGTTISNLTASFNSGGGQIMYSFFVYNTGKIPAYLNKVTIGNKSCASSGGASQGLVTEACNDIEVKVTIGDQDYKETQTVTESTSLDPNKSKRIYVEIKGTGKHAVDGNFTAKIDNITLNYSSQKSGN